MITYAALLRAINAPLPSLGSHCHLADAISVRVAALDALARH